MGRRIVIVFSGSMTSSLEVGFADNEALLHQTYGGSAIRFDRVSPLGADVLETYRHPAAGVNQSVAPPVGASRPRRSDSKPRGQ